MNTFNKKTRIENAIKISSIGMIVVVLKTLIGFVYRTIFLFFLSKTYLGLNGLFTSVLQVLSLSELGITTAITYRFYKPISSDNIEKVGEIMNFFKSVYRYIAAFIFLIGMAILPFVPYLIKDGSEIPKDINIYVIYVLFLLNSVSSYLFSYKLSILVADQRSYINSIMGLVSIFLQNVFQIIVLWSTGNYTLTLLIGIIISIIVNIVFSKWVTKQYDKVFKITSTLSKSEQKSIFHDTKACMCHKIGTTALVATDNAVLTKMVSLAATGVYSNYSMIISGIHSLLSSALGDFAAVFGNAINSVELEEFYTLYKRMIFITLWVACVVSVCLYTVIDDFIFIWLGKDYVFTKSVTTVLCIQNYLTLSRLANGSFINASGLFVKDKIRPLIESLLNIVFSILLTYKYGIVGVFLGTIISGVLTVQWRDPYILYKFSFKRKADEYWQRFAVFSLIFVLMILLINTIKYLFVITIDSIILLVLEALISFIFINLFLVLIYKKTSEFAFWKEFITEKFSK